MKRNEQRRSILKKMLMSGAALFGIGTVNASQGNPSKKVVGEIIKDQDIPLFSGGVRHGNTLYVAGKGAHFDGDIEAHTDEDGVPLDSVPFFPYKVLNALVGIGVFLTVFAIIMFFFPEGGGYFIEYANYEEANPLVTPDHIAPVWYYSPYYSILRAVPDKLGGFAAMGAAVAIFFVVPWLDRSKVTSIRYKGILSKIALVLFGISFLTLGYLGTVSVTEHRKTMSIICTFIYFSYFLLMPIYTSIEKTKPVPDRL